MSKSIQEKIVELIYDLKHIKFPEVSIFTRYLFEEERQKIEIEEYLDDQLSGPEKKRFEQKLNNDPKIRKEFEFRNRVNQSVKEIIYRETLDQAYKNANRKNKVKKLLIQFSAAACIAVIFALALSHGANKKLPPEEKIFSSYYEPFNRSEYSSLSPEFNDGREKYFNRYYVQAAEVFSKLPDSVNIKNEKDFFYGLTLLELGDFDGAIGKFNEVKNNTDYMFFTHAYWYSGLCYLKTNQVSQAKKTFQDIVDVKGYNYLMAQKILKKLD
jgi:hypothetical protein